MEFNIKAKPLFTSSFLDRASKTRLLQTDLFRLSIDPTTKHFLVWNGKILFNFDKKIPRIAFLKRDDEHFNEMIELSDGHGFFLGHDSEGALFFHDISPWKDPNLDESIKNSFIDYSSNHHPLLPASWGFYELRNLMGLVNNIDAEIASLIKGVYEWNKSHVFCGKCGFKTKLKFGGWEKHCLQCNAKHFPRTDPVVIMLVVKNHKTLLARSANWPKGMFSCLAGFMEPGESVEMAVARETFEETGVITKTIRYIASQPWPFPASLMIGCKATAEKFDLKIDTDELEDARWFTKEQVATAIKGHSDWWPARPGSIARFLIESWVYEEI